MTDSEFKAAITFTERDDENGLPYRRVRAVFHLSHELTVSLNLMNFNEAMKHAKEVAVESLFRKVYEDRRKEFFDAIDKLHYTNPVDGSYLLQVDKILALAKRQ